VARDAKARFYGLFLTADLATRLRRVGTRRSDASDADASVAQHQEAFDLGRITWNTIDATGSPDETFARARAVVGREP
jgi:uncharacterized protein